MDVTSAVERLARKLELSRQEPAIVKLARYYVPPYIRFRDGKRQTVDGYWTKRQPGNGVKSFEDVARRPDDSDVTKMTDKEYDRHVRRVDQIADSIMNDDKPPPTHANLDYVVRIVEKNQDPIWKAERAQLHEELLAKVWEEKFAHIPSEGKAVVTGGLGGSGKTSTLKKIPDLDKDQYATLNPDDIKEEMAKMGMIPVIEGMAPMELSAMIHEESSILTKKLAERAYKERKNVIWDVTMSKADRPPPESSAMKKVNDLNKAGYTEIRGVFVDIPVETSVDRALKRHRDGLDAWRSGKKGEYGGRYVPPDLIRKGAPTRKGFNSSNAEIFDMIRDQFDLWEIWDNSKDKKERPEGPVLVDKGRGKRSRTKSRR